MRPILWLTLIVCCVVVCALRSVSMDASAHPPVPAVVSGPGNAPATISAGQPVIFKEDVEGYGETEDDARRFAITNACDRVLHYLAVERNETDYKPKNINDFKELLQKLKVIPATADIEVTKNPMDGYPDMKKATVQVQITADSRDKLSDQARQQRVEQRQHWLGIGLAGFVALLLVGAGYLRLEETTKGYYTGLLRFTGLAFLGAVGGLLWYLS